MRRLNEEQTRVPVEVADRLLQEILCRGMVGVEDGDQFASRMGEPIVEVAGLGVFVALPRQIVDAQIGGELLQLGKFAARPCWRRRFSLRCAFASWPVIKQPDRELVGRIIDGFRRRHGVGKQVRLFVVGRNEYIDGGKAIVRLCPGRARRQRLGDHEEAERKHQHAVHLRHVKQKSGNEVFRLIDRRQRAVVRQ